MKLDGQTPNSCELTWLCMKTSAVASPSLRGWIWQCTTMCIELLQIIRRPLCQNPRTVIMRKFPTFCQNENSFDRVQMSFGYNLCLLRRTGEHPVQITSLHKWIFSDNPKKIGFRSLLLQWTTTPSTKPSSLRLGPFKHPSPVHITLQYDESEETNRWRPTKWSCILSPGWLVLSI